jgi:hypothetical protein
MDHVFSRHYTRDEARALLPQIRDWLKRLNEQRSVSEKLEKRLNHLLQGGADVGGETVNQLLRCLASLREVHHEFEQRQIQVKDMERGLIDFPAIIGGREVFLCWEQDETDIEFWHDLDGGFAGRERL